MKWHTEVNLKESVSKISYDSSLLLLGSCFSSEIGQKLSDLKFNTSVNPLGISFNPISIFNTLKPVSFYDQNFAQIDDLFFHYGFHSEFYSSDKEQLQSKIETTHSNFVEKIKSANWIVITLGTAIIHELNSTKEVVANCHKQHKSNFSKRFLNTDEITSKFKEFHSQLNPETNILINVSPIRHTREGLAENQLSKSILRVACNTLENSYSNVTYLPTYEIMLDELRDYRFYKSDLIHPSEEAVNYIFNRFKETYFTTETISEINKVQKLLLELNHRPLFPESKSHQEFLKQLKIKLSSSKHDFSRELEKM